MRYPLWATVGLLSVVFLSSSAWTQEDSNRRISEVIDRFAKACHAKNLNGIMKTVDVPFHYDKDKIIRDRKELRCKVRGDIKAAVDRPAFTCKVERIQRYKEFRKEYRTSVDDEVQLKLLDEALGNDGWVVFLSVRRPGKTTTLVGASNDFSADETFPVTLLVRMQAGEGKVVGEYVYPRPCCCLPGPSLALCRCLTNGAFGGTSRVW